MIPITGLTYTPQTPGEKQITIRVAKQEGELVVSNNEISTFITVLSGGLNVLFLQGSNFTWDYRFLMRAIERSPDIQVEGWVIRRPAEGEKGEIDDAFFAPGRYNVYVLSDLPADFLPVKQQKLLADAVKAGAGFMMLGGRSSFGAGGWAGTPIEDILPTFIHPADGELEPPGGIKFIPTDVGLDQIRPPGRRYAGRDQARSGTDCRPSWAATDSASARPRRKFWRRRRLRQLNLSCSAWKRARAARSPMEATRGFGHARRKRAGSPIASYGGKSSSGCHTRRMTATTTSS